MKKLSKIFLLFIISTTILSCNDEDIPQPTNLKSLALSHQKLNEVNIKIQELNKLASQGRITDEHLAEGTEEALEPLVNNGIDLQRKMLESGSLSSNDQELVRNATEQQLAQLALALSASKAADKELDTDKVVSCIGAALGVEVIVGLVQNTAQLATVQGATQALKLIGKRYLGWIGLGIAVYSFGQCMDVW